MTTDSGQCGLPVDYVVHRPHFVGDFYCVCTKHLDWAKRRLGEHDIIVSPTRTEHNYRTIISGCVYWDATKYPTPRNRLPLAS